MSKTVLAKLRTKINWIELRFRWATVWRKYRNERYECYDSLMLLVKEHLTAIWRILDLQPGKAMPEIHSMIFKYSGTAAFWFSWEDKVSHQFMLGRPDPKKAAYICDLTSDEEVPYYTHPEILAARAIVSLIKDPRANTRVRSIATEEEVNQLLASYHMHLVTDYGESHPIEVSKVWVNRLNTMLVNLWQNAPVLLRTSQMEKEKGLEFKEALGIAFKEVDPENMELPPGRTSDNEDGRKNLSYTGSCFYTVDRRGIANCREFPSEHLDLSDYSVLLQVAATIYKDITGCGDDDQALALGLWAFKDNEPEWMGDNLFPWERGEQEQQEVEAA